LAIIYASQTAVCQKRALTRFCPTHTNQANYNGSPPRAARMPAPSTSRVAFTVSVPRGGRYLMSVYYGNQTGTIAQQIMRADSGAGRPGFGRLSG